jgi:hypothetical protein
MAFCRALAQFGLLCCPHLAISNVDDLLARIRSLPLEERLRLIERAAHEAAEETPKPTSVVESRVPSMLGLMSDEPDLVDEICALGLPGANPKQTPSELNRPRLAHRQANA